MKKFNQSISVKVEVDSIADKLLESFAPDFKHKEIVAEAIIGNAVNVGGLGYIYNALSGYNNEINFKVGDVIYCSDKSYTCVKPNRDISNTVIGEREYNELGVCEVLEVDIYKPKKLRIKMVDVNKDRKSGKFEVTTPETWVDHEDCDVIVNQSFDEYLQNITRYATNADQSSEVVEAVR